MERAVLVLSLSIGAFGAGSSTAQDPVHIAVPRHYLVKKHCLPGRGFIAVAEAPSYPTTLPMMALFVFNGEVVGFHLEVHERDGWKPWYNQPQGEPVSHDGGPKHYTQTVMIRKGPSAEDCKAAKAH